MPNPLPPEDFENQLPYLAALHSQWTREDTTLKLLHFLDRHREYLHKRALETVNSPDVAVKYLKREQLLNGLVTVIRSGDFMTPTAKPNPETY